MFSVPDLSLSRWWEFTVRTWNERTFEVRGTDRTQDPEREHKIKSTPNQETAGCFGAVEPNARRRKEREMSVRRPRDGEISHQQGTLRVRSEERKEPQVGRLQLFGHEPYDSVQLLALLSI